ncbi:MAG TPA: phosphoglycerate dehydrogenase [Firmicutes bacterium]|nr:phosphoglycerate dehydrogenase [Bacillota bacterium]
MKILITTRTFTRFNAELIEELAAAGYSVVTNTYGRLLEEEELIPLIADADGVIAGLDPFGPAVLRAAQRLRVIARYGVGLDNIDIPLATELGIVVTNTPGANKVAVAEQAIGLMFALARHIVTESRAIKRGVWEGGVGMELSGKILGVVGTGRIGREVAALGLGLRMQVLCYDIYPDHRWAGTLGVQYVSLPELLSTADVVSLHVPAARDTFHLIGAEELNMMKSTALLINTARAEIIDEAALCRALREGRLRGAGLDVLERDSPFAEELLSMDQVVVTPHSGAHTVEAIARMGREAVDNLLAVMKGERPPGIVNKEVFDLPVCRVTGS